MPYFTCPSCHLTHYAPVVRVLDKSCRRCAKALGKEVPLVASDTLAAARSLGASKPSPG